MPSKEASAEDPRVSNAARRLYAFLRQSLVKKSSALPPTELPSQKIKPELGPGPLARRFSDYAWTINLQRVLVLSTAANVVMLGALLLSGYVAGRKAAVEIRAPQSLREEAALFFSRDDASKVSFDQVAFFCNSTLPLMHRIDDGGSPYLGLLQGMVSPEVFARVRASADSTLAAVKKNSITQSLHITSIKITSYDTVTRRVGVWVRGYFQMTIPRARNPCPFVPYRAQLLLESNIVSKLNPTPFFLRDMEERINQAGLDWEKSKFPDASTKP